MEQPNAIESAVSYLERKLTSFSSKPNNVAHNTGIFLGFLLKTLMLRLKLNLFLVGPPIQAIQIQCLSQVDIKDSRFPEGPSKFEKAHQNSRFYMYLNGTWALGPFQDPTIVLG